MSRRFVGFPPPTPIVEPAPLIERTKIFTLKWLEGGQTIIVRKFTWAEPPAHLAALACARDLADRPGSARTGKMIATFGITYGPPSADLCVSLDGIDQPEQQARPGTPPPVFTETTGTPCKIWIDAGRVS